MAEVCKYGEWSDVIHIYAASAALGISIDLFCPSAGKNSGWVSDPFTRRVCGRGVSIDESSVRIMWTHTNVPKCAVKFFPNHYVVLTKISQVSVVSKSTISITSHLPDRSDGLETTSVPASPTFSVSSYEEEFPQLPDQQNQFTSSNNFKKTPSPRRRCPISRATACSSESSWAPSPTSSRESSPISDASSSVGSILPDASYTAVSSGQPSLQPHHALPSLSAPGSPGFISSQNSPLALPCSVSPSASLSSVPLSQQSLSRRSRSSSDSGSESSPIYSKKTKRVRMLKSCSEDSNPDDISSSSDISIDADSPVHAEGGIGLSNNGEFLDTFKLFTILTKKDHTPLEKIPNGVKEDEYFIYNNEENIERRKRNLKGRHWDDAGAWVSGPTNKKIFVWSYNYQFMEVRLKDDVYGTVCNKRVEGGRRRLKIFSALQPQPAPESILSLHR